MKRVNKRETIYSSVLLAFLILSLIVPILRVEGSGKVTVKRLFEVEPYAVWPDEVRIGESVAVDVGITNNDNKDREFNIIISVQDPNGVWHTVSQIFVLPSIFKSSRGIASVTLKSGETRIITLYWIIDKTYQYGWYKVKIRVWTWEPRIDKIVEPPSPCHGFTVIQPGLQPLYQTNSEKLREALDYGKPTLLGPFEGSSSRLITIYKDEFRELIPNPLFHLILELAKSKAESAAPGILKELTPERLKILVELMKLGKDTKEITEKIKALSEAKDISEVAGIIIFGIQYKEYEKGIVVNYIAKDIADNYDFVNIIVVRVIEPGFFTIVDKYDVYIVSPKFTYVYKNNNRIKLESNGLFPFYIGRFERDGLPKIIQEKLWGYSL